MIVFSEVGEGLKKQLMQICAHIHQQPVQLFRASGSGGPKTKPSDALVI